MIHSTSLLSPRLSADSFMGGCTGRRRVVLLHTHDVPPRLLLYSDATRTHSASVGAYLCWHYSGRTDGTTGAWTGEDRTLSLAPSQTKTRHSMVVALQRHSHSGAAFRTSAVPPARAPAHILKRAEGREGSTGRGAVAHTHLYVSMCNIIYCIHK